MGDDTHSQGNQHLRSHGESMECTKRKSSQCRLQVVLQRGRSCTGSECVESVQRRPSQARVSWWMRKEGTLRRKVGFKGLWGREKSHFPSQSCKWRWTWASVVEGWRRICPAGTVANWQSRERFCYFS